MKKVNFKNRGFTLVELLFVIAVVGIMAAMATPFVRELLIESRVEPTAQDVIKVTNVMRASGAASGSTTPYLNLGPTATATAAFSNTAMGKSTSLTVTGAGATATTQHNLGQTNAQVTVVQAANPTAGDSFTVTFPTVNKAACPILATQLNRTAIAISINGTVVKAVNGAYNGTAAQNACTTGDTNTFVFTFQ